MKIFKKVINICFYGFLIMILVLNYSGIISFNLVSGSSMEKNYFDGDYLISVKFDGNTEELKRGDVIIASSPNNLEVIKRVVGLPGDLIEFKNGKLYLNKVEVNEYYVDKGNMDRDTNISLRVLGKDEVFICGDNRAHSYDSRSYGALKLENIDGKVLIKFPTSKILNLFRK